MKTAIYPGTFDPITNGHLDIIERALTIFDRVIVAISHNPRKAPLFSIEERTFLVQESVANLDHVSVEPFDGLLVKYAKSKQADALIRGLREVSDFEYEFQMTQMNRKLMPDIETIFLMSSEKYTYINSTVVKEIANLGGEVVCFLPEIVDRKLKEKMKSAD